MMKIFTCATGDSQSIKDEKGVLPDDKVKSPNNNTMEVCTLMWLFGYTYKCCNASVLFSTICCTH